MNQNQPDIPMHETGNTAAAETRLTRFRRRFGAWRREYGYLLIAGGVPAILFLLLYISQGVHPFGDYSVLTLDLNAQYIGFYNALWNFMHGDGSLLYSFSRELGGEFLGIFDYYVASPFAWIIALFPPDALHAQNRTDGADYGLLPAPPQQRKAQSAGDRCLLHHVCALLLCD